jgi:hypothetical protein
MLLYFGSITMMLHLPLAVCELAHTWALVRARENMRCRQLQLDASDNDFATRGFRQKEAARLGKRAASREEECCCTSGRSQ